LAKTPSDRVLWTSLRKIRTDKQHSGIDISIVGAGVAEGEIDVVRLVK
jgi:hypothetical protein